MKRTLLAAVLAVTAAAAAHAGPVAVTLENIAASNSHTNYTNNGFTQGGFTFVLDHGHVLGSALAANYAFNNGTAFLMHDSTGGALSISRSGGGAFALSKFDFGHYSRTNASSSVTLTGFYADNSTVTQVLSFTDSIQTLALSSAWSNVNRVQLAGDYNQAYDNFVFDRQTVPEPASLALVALALGGVAAVRRSRGS